MSREASPRERFALDPVRAPPRERVSQAARDVSVVTTKTGAQTLHRVRLGDFSDINVAKDEAARLKKRGIDAIVVER